MGKETKIRFTLTTRRVTIDPKKKRQGYIVTLDDLLKVERIKSVF